MAYGDGDGTITITRVFPSESDSDDGDVDDSGSSDGVDDSDDEGVARGVAVGSSAIGEIIVQAMHEDQVGSESEGGGRVIFENDELVVTAHSGSEDSEDSVGMDSDQMMSEEEDEEGGGGPMMMDGDAAMMGDGDSSEGSSDEDPHHPQVLGDDQLLFDEPMGGPEVVWEIEEPMGAQHEQDFLDQEIPIHIPQEALEQIAGGFGFVPDELRSAAPRPPAAPRRRWRTGRPARAWRSTSRTSS